MNPQMLTLLRESRGLSGAQLAKLSGVPQPTISKMENGYSAMDPARVRRLADALDYPESVFNWPDAVYGFGSAAFYHRKQQTLPQTTLRKVQAQVNLTRMRLVRLLRSVDVEAKYVIPSIDVDELGSASEVARAVRALWSLPMGPIRNIAAAIEKAGAVIVHSSFESHRISAISNRGVDGAPTLIVLNTGMPADRERFTLAHELGHLVMHSSGEIVEDAEREADEFASEFLMPAAEIRTQLRGLDLGRAVQLKATWRVSIASVIRRARDLEIIDNGRYTSLNVIRSRNGWTKIEPGEFPHDEPSVLRDVIQVHLSQHEYTLGELADIVGLLPDEFRARYGIPTSERKPGLHVIHS